MLITITIEAHANPDLTLESPVSDLVAYRVAKATLQRYAADTVDSMAKAGWSTRLDISPNLPLKGPVAPEEAAKLAK